MAPTTLVGQKATTARDGRDPKTTGYPLRMCELIKEFDAPRFIARYSLRTPAGVKQAKAAILKGLQNQLDGNGFSFIELLTNCPTTWHTDPLGSLEFMEKYTEKYFECKVFADREGRFWE